MAEAERSPGRPGCIWVIDSRVPEGGEYEVCLDDGRRFVLGRTNPDLGRSPWHRPRWKNGASVPPALVLYLTADDRWIEEVRDDYGRVCYVEISRWNARV